ncbi:hypothetical protein [Meiothermus sp.]|uniref:hypothetical protein n=1 Tax=Meiothermus sp. TaxID=1955249 RepID=UPI00307D6A5C
MIASKPNIEHLRRLKAEARQLRAAGRLDLEAARRIAQASKRAAGDMAFDNWFEPLATTFPTAYLDAIVPEL